MLDVAKPRLPVVDLLLLNHFNGRRADYVLPEYLIEEYGRDWSARVNKLLANGYLTFAEPQEALNSLTIPKLKEILREHGQKLSGKKSQLIRNGALETPSFSYEEETRRSLPVSDNFCYNLP